ncbi:MAG: ABC transporter permease [Ferruginibacter sp.]|nr:ABC transporter permease [Cytophagales bacterium]
MKRKPRDRPLPPRWADRLLESFCAPHLLEEMQGDLHERFYQRVPTVGEKRARRRYAWEVLGFLRPFALKRDSKLYPKTNSNAMLRNYFTIAGRNLWRNPVFSLIHVGGLSTGLACCMLILLYVKDEVSFDRFHAKKDQIFRVTATLTGEKETRKIGSTNKVVGPSFQRAIPNVEAFVRLQEDLFIVRRGTETFNQSVLFVDSTFFSVFSLPLTSGDPATVLSDLRSTVLSEETARKYFGTTRAVGKTLELEVGGKFETYVVSGVAKNPPQNSTIQFSMLLPFQYNELSPVENEWIGFYLNTFVVLHPDADYRTVEPKLDRVFLRNAKNELARAKQKYNFNETIHFGLQPFPRMHLDTEYGDIESRNGTQRAGKPVFSYVLTGIALFILVIACINFINLTVAHSRRRGREIGIRKVVGGQRRQLIAQFLGESFGLCFVAFAVAILLVELTLPVFNELANKRLSFSYLLDVKLVAGYLALFLTTAAIAGFYPAWVLSGFHPVQTLYNRSGRTGKNYLTKGLVVFQFALATFLIIATGVIYSQLKYLTNKDLGYNDENLLTVRLGRGGDPALANLLKAELAKETTIQAVATKDGGQNYTIAKVDGREMEFAISWIDENYLSALQIPLVKGRNFSPDFSADSDRSILVNETFANAAGWQEPIGKEVDFFYDNKKFTVVGVVRDHHFASLKEKITPQLFKVGSGEIWVMIKPDHLVHTTKVMEKTYRKLVPFRPYTYSFVSDLNEKNYEEEAKWKQIITVGAGLSIFISCIGLFGLATLSIGQRTKEIGIRKVFGATVGDIVLLLSRDFVKLVGLAFLVAIPLGYYATNRWLEDFPYRIRVDGWILAAPCAVTLLIALLTVVARTIRAAVANPVKSLRTE